ncbi:putative disease resistance RPP13-like protein 3 [Carex rostrata]
MTEAVVGYVLRKLANIIEEKMEYLGGVGNKVQWVQRELTRIQCCLRDADAKRKGDARVQNWLNELRDVAYRIEDAIDTLFIEVENHCQKDPSFLHKLKKLCHMPLEVPILHKLANELGEIENVLKEISKSRVEYGIELLQEKGKGEAIILPSRRAVHQEVDDESEIVALQADKNNILKLLRPEETLRRVVITIVGTGGLGKTTLAHMVYRSAKAEFKYHIMLSVSQQFSITDLLRKMLRQLNYSVPKNQDVGKLSSKLKSFLSTKRYLIILDDVWGVELWSQLKDTLPEVQNGSRVLMTSRLIDVALSADPKMTPYKLNFLDDKESLDLLLKKALSYQEPNEECPSDLHGLACELSKKCKGLPLALIVLGGILSNKECTYPVWNRVLQTMDWYTKGKDCMEVLAMSYEDMPYHLKACFLYLASFPEDYEISANRLIRMWVAEGFIPHEGRATMEEIAEDCLEELFQRSMIQVLSRSTNGSIKCFQVHDLLRDLAMHEAGQENFVTVLSQASDVNQRYGETRRASLQCCKPEFLEYIGPNTRSLLWFGLCLPKCYNFRLLKVLELVGIRNYTPDSVRGIDKLIHLKYLGFRNSGIELKSLCSFRHMKTLETLDIRGTEATVLPNSLWNIRTLRHVLCDGVAAPTSASNLINLQTLRWIRPIDSWFRKLPILNNLRNLHLLNEDEKYWVPVITLLQRLYFLVTLDIRLRSFVVISLPVEIVYPIVLPNYEKLQFLSLKGSWSKNVSLEADLFPPHLVKLTLINSKLGRNPMPELGKLKSLKKLRLKDVVDRLASLRMICPAGFPVLQHLEMDNSCKMDFTVAQGVMPRLTYLLVCDKIELHLPPELQHITIKIVNRPMLKYY